MVEIITRDGFYASVYNETTNTLIARRSSYTSHECLGDNSYSSTVQQFPVFLNGSAGTVTPSCETGTRIYSSDNTQELDVAVAFEGNECPPLDAVVGSGNGAPTVPFKFNLVEP